MAEWVSLGAQGGGEMLVASAGKSLTSVGHIAQITPVVFSAAGCVTEPDSVQTPFDAYHNVLELFMRPPRLGWTVAGQSVSQTASHTERC